MAGAIVIKIDGGKDVEKVCKILGKAELAVRAPLMKKLAIVMHGVVDRNFESEGRPAKWKKRSALTNAIYAGNAGANIKNTAKYKNAKRASTKSGILARGVAAAHGNKILSGSGDLKKSIGTAADSNSATVGAASSLKYAKIQQFGGVITPRKHKYLFIPCGGGFVRIKKVTIPARPYLVLPPSDIPLLEKIVVGELEKVMAGKV